MFYYYVDIIIQNLYNDLPFNASLYETYRLQYRCKQTPGDSSTSVKIHTNDAYGIAHVRESTHDEHHNAKVGRHTQGFEVQVQEN